MAGWGTLISGVFHRKTKDKKGHGGGAAGELVVLDAAGRTASCPHPAAARRP
jgi:hypothetical protein